MHLRTPVDADGDVTDGRNSQAASLPNGLPHAARSSSVELAEMDNIVNTQDDVMRRYVDLRDGLDVLEQEVSYIRTLNRGPAAQPVSNPPNSIQERPSGPENGQYLSDQEDIDR